MNITLKNVINLLNKAPACPFRVIDLSTINEGDPKNKTLGKFISKSIKNGNISGFKDYAGLLPNKSYTRSDGTDSSNTHWYIRI